MDFNKKQPAILYIDTNKAYYAIDTTVLQIDFPLDIIADLELVSKEKLEQLLTAFIIDNKLPQGEIAIVFAVSMLFEQEFEETLQGKTDAEIQKFLELVPFDDVFSKTYKLNKKSKVVAVNKKIYEAVRSILRNNKFSIIAVTPFSLVQETVLELTQNVDFTLMLSKIDILRQYSMVDVQAAPQSKEESKKPQTNMTRLYVFTGIFGVLLIILIIVIIMQFQPQQPVSNAPKVLPPLPSAQKATTETNSSSSGNLVPKPATSSATKLP